MGGWRRPSLLWPPVVKDLGVKGATAAPAPAHDRRAYGRPFLQSKKESV